VALPVAIPGGRPRAGGARAVARDR
jgi:hypothetical protein